RNAIVDGNVLRADDLLRSHGKKRARLDGGVVHDEHAQASLNASQPGDDASRRRATPLLVHTPCRVGAELEELRARIDEQGDSLTRGQAPLLVLRGDGLLAAAL